MTFIFFQSEAQNLICSGCSTIGMKFQSCLVVGVAKRYMGVVKIGSNTRGVLTIPSPSYILLYFFFSFYSFILSHIFLSYLSLSFTSLFPYSLSSYHIFNFTFLISSFFLFIFLFILYFYFLYIFLLFVYKFYYYFIYLLFCLFALNSTPRTRPLFLTRLALVNLERFRLLIIISLYY